MRLRFVTVGLIATALICSFGCGSDGTVTQQTDAKTGWKTFATDDIEVSLPPTYEGGEPTKADFAAMTQGLQMLNRPDLQQAVEQARDLYILFMLDNDLNNLGAVVLAAKASVSPSLSLDALAEGNLRSLPQGASVIEREAMEINSIPARQAIVHTDLGTIQSRMLMVFIRNAGAAWVFGFAYTGTATDTLSTFERLLPDFQRSASSIRFK